MVRWAVLAAALMAMLLLTGCGVLPKMAPSRPIDPVGVTLEDGRVVILSQVCFDEGPDRVEVIVATEGQLLEEDAPRVWVIEGSTQHPPPVERFTVGVVPDGYQEVVALEEPLDEDQPYVARLTAGGSISQGFIISEDLQEGMVYYHTSNVDPETFHEETACPEATISPISPAGDEER